MICKFQEKKKDRMYKCTECSRSFDYEKNLERHMAKHKEGTLKEGDDQQVISRDFQVLFYKNLFTVKDQLISKGLFGFFSILPKNEQKISTLVG